MTSNACINPRDRFGDRYRITFDPAYCMPTTRRRRIVRRAVMVVAWVVLLVSGYMGSCLAVHFAMGAGWIRYPHETSPHETVYRPIVWYILSEQPGGLYIGQMMTEAHHRGLSIR